MSASETNQIIQRVVGAAIVRGGRVFLTQRKGDDSFPWGWEAPGGKVEEGETEIQALVRELKEEVGIDISYIPDHIPPERQITPCAIGEFTFDWKSGPLVYKMWRVMCWTGEPGPREGQPGCGWFDEQQLAAILPHLLPANKKAFRSILDAMAESRL